MSDLKRGMICPSCEKGKLFVVKKDLAFTYKNEKKEIRGQELFQCAVCDYEALSSANTKRVDRILTDFRRGVDGLLIGDQLKRIREMLGRNKGEMAELLSVNEKTIGRYESGALTQGVQVDKLYRILSAYPVTARVIASDQEFLDVKKYECTYNPKGQFGRELTCEADEHFSFEVDENARAA